MVKQYLQLQNPIGKIPVKDGQRDRRELNITGFAWEMSVPKRDAP